MRVLIDTSIWIDHLKNNNTLASKVLTDEKDDILVHSMIICELMLGGVKKDSELMVLFESQDKAVEASSEETIAFVENNAIFGRGIGYVDSCLLASCILSDAAILTLDKKLEELARELGIEVYGQQ